MQNIIISNSENISGSIRSEGNILGVIKSEDGIKGTISISTTCEDYKGSYEVIPSVYEQIMPTANKHMKEDLSVKSIPYYEVDNTYDGTTVIIGGSIDG